MAVLDDVAREVKAISDAHLPDDIALRRGVRTRVSGGTYSAPVWDGSVQWTKKGRVSPATPPQERLSAGSITEIKDFFVVFTEGTAVPRDGQASATTQTVYRLEWTSGVPGVTDPVLMYLRGTPLRSYRALSKFLVSTEGAL